MSELTDALEYVARFDPPDAYERGLIAQVVAAARRVAEADEIWWCETHDAEALSDAEEQFGCWLYVDLSDDEQPGGACQMVRRPLLKHKE